MALKPGCLPPMSTSSNDQGRAYEFAWINSLFEALNAIRHTEITDNSSLKANQHAWNQIGEDMQEVLQLSADSAVQAILQLEPLLTEDTGDVLKLSFQPDNAGTRGDVRDIVLKRDAINWEIGLSIKHNHEAVKHSRLSRRLDFGNEWFATPCSQQYWDDVEPIFSRLEADKTRGVMWSEISDKDTRVYVPLLQAFIDEVNRSYSVNPGLPQKMVEYLIGTSDYYKVVSHDRSRLTIISTFNVHGTLNKPSSITVSTISAPIVELPTELVAIRFKPNSTNTVEMYLNNGWQLSFRIHNASSRVEPSLKFDVQFIGLPVTVLTIECRWK